MHKHKRLLFYPLTFLSFFISFPGPDPYGWGRAGSPLATAETSALDEALASITAREIKDHIDFLADETLEGRLVGSRGARIASQHIAKHFETVGLEPPIEDETYFQIFPVSARELGEKNSLKIFWGHRREGETCVLGTDFAPLIISGSGRASGKVVFAGYGITAPEYGYDDYAGLEVEGKIVLVLRYEPETEGTEVFEGEKLTRHALFLTKAQNAYRRGARALVITQGPSLKKPAGPYGPLVASGETGMQNWWPYRSDEGRLLSLAMGLEELDIKEAPLPVTFIKTSLAEKVFSQGHRSLKEIEKKIASQLSPRRPEGLRRSPERVPHSFPLSNLRISLEVDIRTSRLKARNVFAVYRGMEFPDEVIILMAHFDHLGRSDEGYFPGADDNASGVAALLEVAEALVFMPRPRRTILLLATSGEEEGLLGARFYTEHPAFPLEKTLAVVNLDTIGRNEPGEISIVGAPKSPWLDNIISKANEKVGLELQYDAQSLFQSADHFAFAKKGVPAIFLTAKGHIDYHTQRDTPEKLDNQKIAQVARLALLALWMIDQTAERSEAATQDTEAPKGWLPATRAARLAGEFSKGNSQIDRQNKKILALLAEGVNIFALFYTQRQPDIEKERR